MHWRGEEPCPHLQVQDDVLDCYGDAETIGKIGTDIRDNKCSWLINTALAICTPAQRKTLESNYARHDAKSEAAVKKIYKNLELYSKFQAGVAHESTVAALVMRGPPTRR